jgi:CRP-like cAMP-binding protein
LEAIDPLVRFAEFVGTVGGQVLCAVDRPTKFVRFSMSGVLKVVCYPEHHDPLVVRYLAPPSFFCVPTLAPSCGYRVELVAHEPGLVALIGYRDFRHALTALRGKAADLVSWNFRTLSRWLYHKTVLLRCTIPERLIYELCALARELPIAADDGVEIHTRITHDDLAELIGATRAPVTHALRSLRDAGLIRQPANGRLIVSNVLLQSSPAEIAKRLEERSPE